MMNLSSPNNDQLHSVFDMMKDFSKEDGFDERFNHDFENFSKKMEANEEKFFVRVATINDDAVGYSFSGEVLNDVTMGKLLYLWHLYIKPNFRGQGLASIMLKDVAKTALKLECDAVRLDVTKSASDFYQKNGAQKTDYTVMYYNKSDLTKLVN